MKPNFSLHPTISIIILFFVLALSSDYASGEALSSNNSLPPDFVEWYNSDNNKNGYMEYEKFLKSENAYGVFPTWQLLLTDTEYLSPFCKSNKFVLPPKKYWKNSVKTIKFIKNNIISKIGKVRIVSGFRPSEFNKCIGGASKSKHLEFGAFDLVSIERDANNELFSELCTIWKKNDNESGFGLGAYWDKMEKLTNPNGRFHIDTFGKRTWGLDYTKNSSFCKSIK